MQHFGVHMRVTGVSGDAEVYRKHRDELTGFARVLVGRADAPDVVSSVVTRLLASGRSLTDLREPRTYLMRAVLNESRSVIRKRRFVGVTEQPYFDHQTDDEITKAVARLPPRQRAVTFLAYWEEMTSSEIAEMLGMRPGTVRRYLHLAREKLRGVLDANQ
jgi:RNA polymerase sigma-70 factor, ECF subfamily